MEPWPHESSGELLDELVTATRLIGADPDLVLHGGGNSSVKTSTQDVTGRAIDVLLMKASGTSMAEADADSFTALRLDRLRELLPPTVITDDQFANELRLAQLDASAPVASVETLVHAALPHRAVLHSHADVILAITDRAGCQDCLAEVLPQFLVVDYAMPGVDLGAAVARAWAQHGSDEVHGIVVPGHGIFTMGETPREACERHRAAIDAAMAYVNSATTAHTGQTSSSAPGTATEPLPEPDLMALATLRRALSDAAGQDLLVQRHGGEEVARFVRDPALLAAAARGPITPDHATRTKPSPLIGRDVEAYCADYRTYVATNATRRQRELRELDPAPRVVLDPELGLLTAGTTASLMGITADIARHAMSVITRAEQLGGYQPVDSAHVFDLEYWSLQQAKMTPTPGVLAGQVAIVTGAASGIGKACAQALLDAGCAVVGWDISESVTTTFDSPAWLGVRVDVSDEAAQRAGLQAAVEAFGGVDILVVGAGIFPTSKPLGEMELSAWQRTMSINVDSVVTLYGLVWPFLALSRGGGRVVVVASKNVLAPGTGAAAYSSSKAALTQLSRVAALEWAPKGIRVNMLHPDAVFDTGLWTPELIAARAEHYGMSVDEYKRRNLLKTEITSATCGQLALAMVTEPFRCTTGAQVPIDGGSDRVI